MGIDIMKIQLGGKWEIDITPSEISDELEAEIKKAVNLVISIDNKVEDKTYGNDTSRGSAGTHKSK